MTALSPALASLRAFAKPRASDDRCELCSAALAEPHDHLVSPTERVLRCACVPCALLFHGRTDGWRRAPAIAERLDELEMSDGAWESLGIPVGLAFFVRSSVDGRVLAHYPSPAGPTESAVAPEAWAAIAERNPRLSSLVPEVEGLLARRIGPSRAYYRVSIADCFALVGLVRAGWRGFGGGAALWAQVDQFFDVLEARCRS